VFEEDQQKPLDHNLASKVQEQLSPIIHCIITDLLRGELKLKDIPFEAINED
jgi:hypothetical protein